MFGEGPLFPHFLMKYDVVWKMLVQSLLKGFLDHLTQQFESVWLESSLVHQRGMITKIATQIEPCVIHELKREGFTWSDAE